jgi:hypothetical protein
MNWELDLPKRFSEMDQGYRNGRNPYEGFVRSYGIDSANVEELCDVDPDFNAAVSASQQRMSVGKNNIMNLYMILKFFFSNISNGNILEFGSSRGGAAIFLAHVTKNFFPNINVIGFDTFGGGDLQSIELDELRAHAASEKLDNLRFAEGRFEELAKKELKDIGLVSLVHINCDNATSIAFCYETVKEHLVDGAYIVFDGALASNCLGAFEAIEEHLIKQDNLNAEQNFPHLVFRYPANFAG